MSSVEESLIRTVGLHYTYQAGTRSPVAALRGIDLCIAPGDYVALVGANGSGKSTLLRHLNALLLPSAGDVRVAGWSTRDSTHLREIRSIVGMVFQEPDSQIVASVVEEDVAFGPENLGIQEDELSERVDWALRTVDLSELRHRASHMLSAGQKQRLAIASTLAMRPRCLVLDEATSMLDPAGRRQVLETIRTLHHDGMTIVTATHNMSEAAEATSVVVLAEGCIAMQGTPREVFAREDELRALRLDTPPAARMAHIVAVQIAGFPTDVLSVGELAEAVAARCAVPRG